MSIPLLARSITRQHSGDWRHRGCFAVIDPFLIGQFVVGQAPVDDTSVTSRVQASQRLFVVVSEEPGQRVILDVCTRFEQCVAEPVGASGV